MLTRCNKYGNILPLYYPPMGDMEVYMEHMHTHSHSQTKAVTNRLSRAIGHLEAVKRMVEEGRDCSEVLIQLAAVRSALSNTGKIILKDHLEHCIVDAVRTGSEEELEKLLNVSKKAVMYSCQ